MSVQIDPKIEQRLKRGREARDKDAGLRNLCIEFERGDQYLWLGKDGLLRSQLQNVPTHSVHSTTNLIKPIIRGKQSLATQRVPAYQILPSTLDPEDIDAAHIGERIARAGYDQWDVRRATRRAVYYALVADEAFGMPYWDGSLGPFVEVTTGGEVDPTTGLPLDPTAQPTKEMVPIGDVRYRILFRNQVSWESGVEFEESPWYAIEYAKPIDELETDPEFIASDEKLTSDADTRRTPMDRRTPNSNLVLVTEYLERPCTKWPQGRRLTYANGRMIFPEEEYPLKNAEAQSLDEPCLHRLSYAISGDSDSDYGLVRHLIDVQRTYNDAKNKSLELKNLALNTQILAPRGSMSETRQSDEPGAIVYYDPDPTVGFQPPTWRPPPDPAMLGQLQDIMDRAKTDMGFIADANEIPAQIQAGKAIQSLTDRDQSAFADFISDLAAWHSKMMRDALVLVQRYYTEDRVLKVMGRITYERVDSFTGADLHGETDVYVLAGSIEPRTRDAIEAKIMSYADRGWVTPEVAMMAIDSGTAESLVDTYERDAARAHLIIQKISRGPELLLNAPMRPVFPDENAGMAPVIDPATGQPAVDGMGQPILQPVTEVPDWMPRPFDRIPIQKAVVEDFLKGTEYDTWDDSQKEAIHLYYSALLQIEERNAARDAALQVQQAQDLGMANAAKPTTAGRPSMPSPAPGQAPEPSLSPAS